MNRFDTPFPPRRTGGDSDAAIADLRAKALHSCGLVTGMLRCGSPVMQALFSRLLVRRCLIHALRQERHTFTDSRFAEWMAGTCPLSDENEGHRPPRLIAEAVLETLSRLTWQPLVGAANSVREALVAPADLVNLTPNALDPEVTRKEKWNESGDAMGPRGDLGIIASEAEALMDGLITFQGEASLPFSGLDSLHQAAAQSVTFAPREAVIRRVTVGGIARSVEEPAEPAPLWALDFVAGNLLAQTGALRPALPLPGLIRAEALRGDLEQEERTLARATAFCEAAQDLRELCEAALAIETRLARLSAQERTSSRAPECAAWLATSGSMRSSQLETLLGATRLGVRGIVAKLEKAGLLTLETVAGVKLYGLAKATGALSPAFTPAKEASRSRIKISAETLAEYDAAMNEIDALLARTGAHDESTE